MKCPMDFATGAREYRCMLSLYFFAVRYGNGSLILECSFSLPSSRCGWWRHGRLVHDGYGSNDPRTRKRGKGERQDTRASSAYGEREDESAGPFFTYRWEGCVIKGISMTFMERDKDVSLKMIIVADAKYPI